MTRVTLGDLEDAANEAGRRARDTGDKRDRDSYDFCREGFGRAFAELRAHGDRQARGRGATVTRAEAWDEAADRLEWVGEYQCFAFWYWCKRNLERAAHHMRISLSGTDRAAFARRRAAELRAMNNETPRTDRGGRVTMGLDITAYEKVELVHAMSVDAYNESEEWQDRIDRAYIDKTDSLTVLYRGPCTDRTDGLLDGVYRTSGETYKFGAGSYGGYNEWRNDLARFAGYVSADSVWQTDPEGPFVELINFSDCEGFIGPKTSAKLAADFREYLDSAMDHADEWWWEHYEAWMGAFEIASRGGVVKFH